MVMPDIPNPNTDPKWSEFQSIIDSMDLSAPGGNYPEPILGSNCGKEQICDCLGDSLARIEYAINRIAYALMQQSRKSCDDVTKCIDEIIKAIDDKFRGVQRTTQECRSMLQMGMAGTLEYALTCTKQVTDECDTECSLGDPTTEGKCCKNCGQEKCCCKDGVCEPCPEDETKKKKYQGWCNPQTQAVLVLKEGESGPAGYTPVGNLTDTEQAAIAEAQSYCGTPQKPQIQIPPLPPIPGGIVTGECGVLRYCSAGGTAGIFEFGSGAAALGAGAAITGRLRAIGMEGINIGSAADIANGVLSFMFGGDWLIAQDYIPQIAPLIGCNSPQFVEPAKILASIGLAEKTSGTNFSEFTLPYRYAMHAACRNVELSPDAAMAAYLANAIDGQTLDCHWAIAGFCPEALQWNLEASRAKPVPLQLAMMRRREFINETQYNNGMRQLGYIKGDDVDNLFKLTEQIPTMNDITRLMVRDSADESIEFWPQSDEIFASKYTGLLKKWAMDQGIPDEFFKMYWRAHWTIPSPTQLFEFWRRLRKKPEFGGEDELWKRIAGALTQQDILPFWHKYYQAVAYLPLGRVDIRRAFNIGAMNEDEALEAYTQIGYSDENAASLLKFAKQLRRAAVAGHKAIGLWLKFGIDRQAAATRMTDDGLPQDIVNEALDDAAIRFMASPYAASFVRGDISRDNLVQALTGWGVPDSTAQQIADLLALKRTTSPVLGDYIAGIVDRSAAWSNMTSDGMNGDAADRLLDKADRTIRQNQVIACTKAIKRRYLMGELDAAESQGELSDAGVASGRTSDIISSWNCEKARIGKQVPASKLCEWLARGAIDSTEFLRRLKNVGYDDDAAAMMLDDCLISINTKRLAEAKREAKEQAALDMKRQRALARAAGIQAREATAAANARVVAAKIRANREKQLLSAADKIAAKCDCDIYASLQIARAARDHLRNDVGLNQDESLQVLIQAVEAWEGGSPDTLAPIIDAMGEAAATVTMEPAL